MTRVVSDEVWRQLDPHVGRLSRRGALRVWVIVAACVALVIGCLAASRSGLTKPRLNIVNFRGDADASAHISPTSPAQVHQSLYLRNSGWSSVTVTGVGRSYPNATLTAAGPLPVTIGPGQQVVVVLSYTITSCAGPTHADPLPIRTSRFWGTQTVSAVNDAGNEWLEDILAVPCGS